MQWKRMLMLLAVAGFAAGQAGTAAAQQSPSNRPAPPKAKAYFDMYEPVQRMRLRRETCGDREQTNGAFCVKACKSGYVAMTGTKPPRCRSLTPLPAGQFPGAVRKEIDVQPRRPAPAAKPGAANSGNPKNGW